MKHLEACRSAVSQRTWKNQQPWEEQRLGQRGSTVSGFTLIELLVVIAIIALLITILLPSLNSARDQARMLKCSANLSAIGKSLHFYADEYGDYVPRGIWKLDKNSTNAEFYWETLWEFLGLPDARDEVEKIRELPEAGVLNCPAFKLPSKPGVNDSVNSPLYIEWRRARSYAVNDEIQPRGTATDRFGRITETYPQPLLKIDGVRRPSEACYMADTAGSMDDSIASHRDSQLSRNDVAMMFDPVPAGDWQDVEKQQDPRHRKGKRMNVLYFDSHVSSVGLGDLPPLYDPVSTDSSKEDSYYRVHVFWAGEYGNYVPSQTNN